MGAYIDMLRWWHVVLIWLVGVLIGYWYIVRFDKKDEQGEYVTPIAIFWPICLTLMGAFWIITGPFKLVSKAAEAGKKAAKAHKEQK